MISTVNSMLELPPNVKLVEDMVTLSGRVVALRYPAPEMYCSSALAPLISIYPFARSVVMPSMSITTPFAISISMFTFSASSP